MLVDSLVVKMPYYVCFFFLVCLTGLNFADEIWEIDQDNFQDVLKERKAAVMYITDRSCEKSRRLYHKFVTTSQTFSNDDVIFIRTQDKSLAERFEVTSFPGIVFYEFGSNIPRAYRGDITSNELSKLVIKAMRGDFRSLDLKHSVELTKGNYDSIMNVKGQCKLVMLHEDDDDDDIDVFEDISEIFGNEDGVLMARVNVDKQKTLKKTFNTVEYPTIYFYSKSRPDRVKLDNGRFSIDEMVKFINKECGTFRVKGGRLNPFAGLVPELDNVIDTHGKDLYEITNLEKLRTKLRAVINKLPDTVDETLAEFYVDLIDGLIESGSIEALDGVRSNIYVEMDTAGPLAVDQLFRKRNIVEKLIDIIGRHLMTDFSRMGMDFGDRNFQNPESATYQKIESHDEL